MRDAGVQCRDDHGEVKNVRATNIINPTHMIMVSWELGNSTRAGVPTVFEIECFSTRHEKHSIAISVDNRSSTINLGGLLPSTSYNCCMCISGLWVIHCQKNLHWNWIHKHYSNNNNWRKTFNECCRRSSWIYNSGSTSFVDFNWDIVDSSTKTTAEKRLCRILARYIKVIMIITSYNCAGDVIIWA